MVTCVASQARPLPSFHVRIAGGSGTRNHVRDVSLWRDLKAKAHQVSEHSHLQQVRGKAPKLQTDCSTII